MALLLVEGGKRGRLIANRYPSKCFGCATAVPASRFDDSGGAIETRGAACKAEVVDDKTGAIEERWITFCLKCAPGGSSQIAAPSAPLSSPIGSPRASFTILEDGQACVQIVGGRPSDDQFACFKTACHSLGAEFRAQVSESNPKPGSVLPMATVPELARVLRGVNIEVELDPPIRAALQAQADAAKKAAATADARIQKIINDLAARGITLWQFQENGVLFLMERRQALLNDDMGLGKTPQCLMAIPEKAAVIVVCPAVARGNWLKEARKWRPEFRSGIVEGTEKGGGGLNVAPKSGEIAILSFKALPDTIPTLAPHITVLIVDEAHNGKGGNKTQIGKRLRKLHEAVSKAFGLTWLATGTAILNRIDELYEILDLAGLATEHFGTKKRFKKMFKQDPDGFVVKLRKLILRREKSEVLKDLPPKVYSTVTVEITDEDRAKLDEVLAEIVRAAGEYKIALAEKDFEGRGSPLTEEEKERIRQDARDDAQEAIDLAFNGKLKIPFELTSRVKMILALAKTEASMQFLDDLEMAIGDKVDPILFFSTHVDPVRRIAARPGWCCITGETPQDERDRLIEEFQAGKYRGMGLTIKAGGVAITLTRANKELFNDIEWTPALNDQAIDRAHRIGQVSSVHITTLVAAHILDTRINELNEEKRELIRETVGRATRTASERMATEATHLDAILGDTTTKPIRPPVFAIKTRPAESPDEIAAASLLASHAADEFTKSMARQLNANGGKLSDAQWKKILPWSKRLAPTVVIAKPTIKDWIRDSLSRLQLESPGFFGFRPHEIEIGKDLASRADSITEDELPFVRRFLKKYSNVIGEEPK